MIITTSGNVDGYRIIQYLGVVNANIVEGTGFLSEFSAGINDIRGGRTDTYISHFEKIHSQLVSEIKRKAEMWCGDAVISLKIDFGEISGKGMQMLVGNAYGTVVKIVRENEFDNAITEVIIEEKTEEEKVERQRAFVKYAKKVGNTCSSCGFDKLFSMDKACPKCRSVFSQNI